MKCIAVVLLMIATFLFPLGACAETVEQNGFYVTLDTDKETYAIDEEIIADISMYNAGKSKISDIEIRPYVSDPYTLTDTEQAAIKVSELTDAFSMKLDVFFSVDNSELPDTGDHFNLSRTLMCLVLSGVAVFMLYRTSNGKRWLSFVLVVCTLVTSVVIPDSVTSIGSGAFWGCSNL